LFWSFSSCSKSEIELNEIQNPSFGESNVSLREGSGIEALNYYLTEVDSFPRVDSLLSSTSVSSFLTNENLSMDSSFIVGTNLGKYMAINLTFSSLIIEKSVLAVMIDTNEVLHAFELRLMSPDQNGDQLLELRNVIGNYLVHSGNVNFDDPDPDLQKEVCRNTTETFGDCMECSLEQLMDNWLGKVACGLNFAACATASLIHCLGPVDMEPAGN
jgi:hypothetical protein